MDENTQGQEVDENQQSPVPSDEQGEILDAASTVETQEEAVGLPEEAKERTKNEFAKLQTQLREERSRREYYEQVFSKMQPQQDQPKFIDPISGMPNEEALLSLAKQSQDAANRAQDAERKIVEYQQDQENKSVYAVHPELNPDTKTFNKDLHNLTRSYLLDSMVNPDGYDGKQLSFMEAAEKAKGLLGRNTEEAKKQGATEAIEQLTPKEQASLDAVGSPSRRTDSDIETLRTRSRGQTPDAKQARIERFNRILAKE